MANWLYVSVGGSVVHVCFCYYVCL